MHTGRGQQQRWWRDGRRRAAALGAALLLGAQGAQGALGLDRTRFERSARVESYAVIANPAVRVGDVSLERLRAMFRGAQRTWDDGTRVVLIVQSPGSRTRAVVLRTLLQMDEETFKRFSIARTFGGGAGPGLDMSGPTLVSNDAMAKRLTATIRGAIAVVAASEVDPSVRVLRVDGRLPGADGYPITAGAP